MITIVDYGLGNIRAFKNVYERLNIPTKVARSLSDLKDAQKIILPGVGAFDYAMSQLNASGMRDELEKQVISNKVPMVGICVGMQMLARSSDEGSLTGLGWIEGEVRKFDERHIIYKTRLPHMGWNTIKPVKNNPILTGIKEGDIFYFLHSYYFLPDHAQNILAQTNYGINYASAVNHENIYGIQFHPEKSHQNGVQLLKNFADL